MPEEKPNAEAQQAQAPKEAPKEQKAGSHLEKKYRKINEMSLTEVDKKLEEVKEKMGNLTSKYALGLLKRKQELSGA